MGLVGAGVVLSTVSAERELEEPLIVEEASDEEDAEARGVCFRRRALRAQDLETFAFPSLRRSCPQLGAFLSLPPMIPPDAGPLSDEPLLNMSSL
jgi:hypothetical protein